MLQIYRIILEYSSNIYIFLDIFQLSTLFLLYHTKIGINHEPYMLSASSVLSVLSDLIVNVKVIVKVERLCLSPSPSPPYKTPLGYIHPFHIGNYPYHSLPSAVPRNAPPGSLHLS